MTDQPVKMAPIEPYLQTFSRKPFKVTAVRVTDDNITIVAEWCGGQLKEKKPTTKNPDRHFVKVPVKRPLTPRQSLAFPGDYVSYNGNGFKVYTKEAFEANFVIEQPES